MGINVLEILNTVRDNSSADYQARIPEATRDNMEEIRALMIDGDNIAVANEFMHTLLNKVIKSVIISKIFENPLKSLKKGSKPVGDAIEEIYNNFLKGQAPDETSEGNEMSFLKRNLPDTKTVYHRMNYKQQYVVTVTREKLSKAFSSLESLESYINNTINTLFNSAELDEFLNTKELIASALKNNAMVKMPIADPLISKENANSFIKTVKTVSGMMVFPDTSYNAYLEAQKEDKIPITTFSRKNEQILIIDTATDTSVGVDVLASTFNMSVAEFNDTRKIVINAFPKVELKDGTVLDIRASIVDEQFFQIFDDLFTVTSFQNPKDLYMNYYLNVWQTLAYSILVNAVAFYVPTEA